MSRVFVTSDTFFGREKILEIANRPFSSLAEMERKIIANWNRRVSKSDLVYVLGGFAWDPSTAKRVLKKLNGRLVFFINTPSDSSIIDILDEDHALDDKHNIMTLGIWEDSDINCVFCYYPLAMWEGMNRGVVHFHGYSMFSLKTDLNRFNRVNCAVDHWGWAPVEIDMIKELIKDQKEIETK